MNEQAKKFLGGSLSEYFKEEEDVCVCCPQTHRGGFPQMKIPLMDSEYR